VLKFVELTASDDKERVEKEACQWSRDIVVEEWRSWGENVLTRVECVLNGLVGGINVGLVF